MTEAETTPSTAPNPGACLILLCDALPALKAAFEAGPRDRDENPAWPPYIAACDAITALPALHTMAGLLAPARAAKVDGPGMRQPDFTTHAAEWAWNITQPLPRLAPEPAQ